MRTGVPNSYESYSKLALFAEKKISSFEFASAHVNLHEQCSLRRNEVKKKHREKEGGKYGEETKNKSHVMI